MHLVINIFWNEFHKCTKYLLTIKYVLLFEYAVYIASTKEMVKSTFLEQIFKVYGFLILIKSFWSFTIFVIFHVSDVVRNMGTNSSSSSLFGGSSNQSPVSGTPIQLSNCVNQPINSTASNIIQQQNNGQLQQHSTYVDQRGRSQLIKPATPARELPV